ncbi:MAG: sugar ABC transporter permease [Proteobacteria bacterium]|nr:sugar ABC transporter permease [Pseudomonadota bacterium]
MGKSGCTGHGALLARLQVHLPKLVLSPSVALVLLFVYGFILWTAYLSVSTSRMLPTYEFAGLAQYAKLWSLPTWHLALRNLFLFALLYIAFCVGLGLLLAIALDQRIRAEGGLRALYLYPMAISFIVAGTAWKWILNPGLGLEKTVRAWGFSDFTFDWIVDPDMAIYTVVIAAIWQTSGFVMAMFLAGLRGIDSELIHAAMLDGASMVQIYRRVIIPQLRPAFLSAVIVLSHMAIKNYDLVIALTGGGPGNATELPATFMYSYTFNRNQMGVGAASAIVMLMIIASVMVPYLFAESKGGQR